jgi:hypothetical protein
MDPIFNVLIGIGVLVAVVLISRKQDDQRQKLAEMLRLQLDSSRFGSTKMSGRYAGVPVRVHQYTKGNGNHSVSCTEVQADVIDRLPEGLRILHETDIDQIGKIFGLQDIVVGHPRLDRLCVIKAKQPEEAREFLNRPGVADALADFFERYDRANLEGGTLQVTQISRVMMDVKVTLDAAAEVIEVLAGRQEYRPHAAWEEAGLDPDDFADADQLVKAELARRKKEGRTASTPFDREMPQPEQFGQPQAGPKEGSGSSGDGSW